MRSSDWKIQLSPFEAIHTFLHLTSTVSGGAADQAAERKRTKYSSLPTSNEFIPMAIE